MENKFYDELATLAAYPLALLTPQERGNTTTNGEKSPSEILNDSQKSKIAGQIDNFLLENEEFLAEHVHEVKVIESMNKLREQCNALGIPWEKGHIVQVLRKAVGKIEPTSPIFENLPNDILLPFLLMCARSMNDLKSIFQQNSRLRDRMSDPQAIYQLCRTPFYEWEISGELAVDFLSEFATGANDLTVDLSFCQDLNDTLLRKFAKSCPNVISVNLSGCRNITDEGVKNFATNHRIRHIYCFDCPQITTSEESRLRELLPHCTVYG